MLQYFKDLENESKAIKHSIMRVCWHMRGSVTIDQAFMLGHTDFEILKKIIDENVENMKKTKMPLL